MFYLLREQVGLVEEEDDGDAAETTVVDDGVKDIDALHNSVGHSVLQETLVKGTRCHKKQNGRNFVETLEPLLTLRPLTSDVDKFKRDSLDVNVVFLNASCGFTRVENVFPGW